MHFSWPQTEECWRDTLVHKAEKSAFDKIANLYSFTWAKAIPENSWRKALKLVALGPRDLFPTLFGAVEGIFQGYNEVFKDIYYVPGVDKQLYREDGWDRSHVYRFVRIGTKTYWSIGLYGLNKYLRLTPYKSSYWDQPSWEEYVDPEPVGEDVHLLPFRVYERQAGPSYPTWGGRTYSGGVECTVEFVFLSYVTDVPETFIVNPTDYTNATPGACPAADGPQDPGDTPICTTEGFPNTGFLIDTDTADEIAGNTYEVTASDDAGDLIFTSTIAHNYYKNTGVRFSADTGGVLPGGISSSVDYYCLPLSSTTFSISTTSEGSPVAFVDSGTPTFRVTRSVTSISVDDAQPIYLYDGQVAPEIEDQLNKLCPAGSHVLLRASVV